MIMKIAFVLYLAGSLFGLLLILIQTALKGFYTTRFRDARQWLLPWYHIVTLLLYWFIAFALWNNYLFIDESGRQIFFVLSVTGLLFIVVTGFVHIIINQPTDPIKKSRT